MEFSTKLKCYGEPYVKKKKKCPKMSQLCRATKHALVSGLAGSRALIGQNMLSWMARLQGDTHATTYI